MSTDLSTPRTLYLLDDNDDFRATAKWWLSGAGYDVIDFGDAQAAIDALAALDAAAITRACLLLDVRMPSMTGLQVHDVLIEKGITGARARPSLPIVYMTGHGDVPLAVQAMEKGAITFLEKPFEDSALESALARAFEAGAQSQHTAAAEPDSAAIVDSYGWVLYRLGRSQEALVELRRAWGLARDPEIGAHLGEVLWTLGRREEAQRYFDESARLDPDNRSLRRALQTLGLPAPAAQPASEPAT